MMAQSNCSTALRMLRRAENRRRMSSETAQAINAHFIACNRCDSAQGYSFRKRYPKQLGIAPKVRPWKPPRVAAPATIPFVPTEATNGTPPAETAPKPKRVRKPRAKPKAAVTTE